jgi:ferritin-like metal-binding protein YciE
MSGKSVTGARDLLVLLLGELLHVERRLAGGVLRELIDACSDEPLAEILRAHLTETQTHVQRLETAFLRLEVAPSAHLSRAFESAVAQHDELTPTISEGPLADAFHAQAGAHTEHWEIAAYRAVLAFAQAVGLGEAIEALEDSLADEERAAEELREAVSRLGGSSRAR